MLTPNLVNVKSHSLREKEPTADGYDKSLRYSFNHDTDKDLDHNQPIV